MSRLRVSASRRDLPKVTLSKPANSYGQVSFLLLLYNLLLRLTGHVAQRWPRATLLIPTVYLFIQ